MKKVTIGTRGSKLALWQSEWVKSAIVENNPSVSVDLTIIKTKGDRIQDVPLAKVGGKGLFVKEIEEALLDGRIDLAVHSMKDMPAQIPKGLCIGAVPRREVPGDVLISKDGTRFAGLKKGAKIGTSSLRRGSQLLSARPDLEIVPLRGNLDTRLKKLDTGDMDGIILAAAGVKRLGLEERITEVLDTEIVLPAVGQGALCIESRENDSVISSILKDFDHPETRAAVLGERAFLNRLEGGCQVPIAAYGVIKNGLFVLDGLVAEIDGSRIIKESISGPVAESESIGVELARKLLDMGAGEILERLKVDYFENR